MMQWGKVNQLSKIHGDSFFVFDEKKFKKNFQDLSNAFNAKYANTRIAYSYKTNYTPTICKIVDEMGGYAEVVSEMEYSLAKSLEVDGNRIIYNGPYKSFESIRSALIDGSIVNLDSMRDYDNLVSIASEAPQTNFDVAIRCNFILDDDKVSRFGFDVDGDDFQYVVEGITTTKNIRLSGLHCHFPDRDLNTYKVRAEIMLHLSKQLFKNEPPDFLNLGGGFFGAMPESLKGTFNTRPPEFQDYADLIGDIFNEAFSNTGKLPILFIEPGTALVANTFKFYTKVISNKIIREHNIATVAGSIFNISPTARSMNLPVNILHQPDKKASTINQQTYDIAGFTCIEGDYLSKGLKGHISVGDYLVYENVGSYSIVMKPPFILPNVPILGHSDQNNEFKLIKKRETADYIFQNFVS